MKKYIAILIFFVYAVAGVLTLYHYNISWDEPDHFIRGQDYLWFFLTGESSFKSLPSYNLERARKDPNYHQRSLYQNDQIDFNYYIENDGGHPPLNGILASFFNYIFYQKLGILGDVESYHFFEILISSILVALIFLFAAEVFNIWAGLLAAIFLSTYPLFWAESHFNIKDPIETCFFALTIYFFWKGILEKKAKFVIYAGFWAGAALGTKFNILFLPFIIIPWLIVHFFIDKLLVKILFPKRILLSLVFFPIIMFGVFFLTWPFLWQDIVGNTIEIFKFYQDIGTESNFQQNLTKGTWNNFAILWIVFTTQPLLIFFFIFGLFSVFFLKGKQKSAFILWFLWFILPILRVSIPGATIYGGARQIMEFIPAMSLIAGVGAFNFLRILINFFNKNLNRSVKIFIQISFIALVFIILLRPLIKLHPNENVYFNFLSGGLKKMMEDDFPAAGNSLGNAYLQGLEWFNENAEREVKLSLIQSTKLNIPEYKIRPDIKYSNYHWSGINRRGEYLIEVTHNSEFKYYFYAWEYVEKFLEPVYEVKVDGASILKIWKNDLKHTKKEYRLLEKKYLEQVDIEIDQGLVQINLPEQVRLSRINFSYSPTKDCKPFKLGYVFTSQDGQNWIKERDSLPEDQLGRPEELTKNSFRVMFASREAKFIKIEADHKSSCIFNSPKIDIVVF